MTCGNPSTLSAEGTPCARLFGNVASPHSACKALPIDGSSSQLADDTGPKEPLTRFDQLLEPFWEAGKPAAQHRIGLEAEKFAVHAESGLPLPYDGDRAVAALLGALQRQHGWQPIREFAAGPVIALARNGASITLEPGAQLELSGAPWADVHQADREFRDHLAELAGLDVAERISWLSAGFHPLATPSQLPWVPKQRYPIMRDYFQTRGQRGRDMMRRTATVQVNLDYTGEADAMRKLRVALRLSPLATAMFANGPFAEGRVAGGDRSLRASVWLDVDPDRTGLLPALQQPGRAFVDYVDWALDVPMFMFKRGNRVVANAGQSFRSFWRSGFQGYRATRGDWDTHLNTLFPEVRLKRVVELRGADALPRDLTSAVPALWVGLLYDETALGATEQLTESFLPTELERLRTSVGRHGLDTSWRGRPLRELAEQVVDIARGGLARRARLDEAGVDERRYLDPLVRLVEAGRCPADELLSGLSTDLSADELRRSIMARTAL